MSHNKDLNEILGGEEEDDDDNEFAGELNKLEQSMHRVVMRDQMTSGLPLTKTIKEMQRQVETEATNIYLKKEMYTLCDKLPQLFGKELDQRVSELLQCTINTVAVQTAVNTTHIMAQLAEEMGVLQQDSDQADPDTMSVIKDSHASQEASSELSRLMKKIAEKQRLVVEKRAKLARLHSDLHDAWRDTENRDLARADVADTEDMTRLRELLTHRRGNVEIIVHFLQTLLTGLQGGWGQDRRTVETLEACELFNAQSDGVVDWARIFTILNQTP